MMVMLMMIDIMIIITIKIDAIMLFPFHGVVNVHAMSLCTSYVTKSNVFFKILKTPHIILYICLHLIEQTVSKPFFIHTI